MKRWFTIIFLAGSMAASAQLDVDNPAITTSQVTITKRLSTFDMSKWPTKVPKSDMWKVNKIPENLTVSTAFFCRIEDAIAKRNKVNFKFRLGSVQYVDALEGKGYFEAIGYSRATNFSMTRKQ